MWHKTHSLSNDCFVYILARDEHMFWSCYWGLKLINNRRSSWLQLAVFFSSSFFYQKVPHLKIYTKKPEWDQIILPFSLNFRWLALINRNYNILQIIISFLQYVLPWWCQWYKTFGRWRNYIVKVNKAKFFQYNIFFVLPFSCLKSRPFEFLAAYAVDVQILWWGLSFSNCSGKKSGAWKNIQFKNFG